MESVPAEQGTGRAAAWAAAAAQLAHCRNSAPRRVLDEGCARAASLLGLAGVAVYGVGAQGEPGPLLAWHGVRAAEAAAWATAASPRRYRLRCFGRTVGWLLGAAPAVRDAPVRMRAAASLLSVLALTVAALPAPAAAEDDALLAALAGRGAGLEDERPPAGLRAATPPEAAEGHPAYGAGHTAVPLLGAPAGPKGVPRLAALEAVLASLGDGLLVVAANGEAVAANPALAVLLRGGALPRARAERLRRLRPRDLRGVELPADWDPEGRALAGEAVTGVRAVMRMLDGCDRVLDLSAAPIRAPGGRIAGCALLARDVTGQQHLADQRDDFIAVAAHELRGPLNSLLLDVQLLARRWARDGDPALGRPLERLSSSAHRLKGLVEGLLDLTRLERGALALRPEEADGGALVRQHVARFCAAHPAQRVVLRADLVPDALLDRLRVEQILENLLENAVKYGAVEAPVEVWLRAEGGSLALTVRDHGAGLAQDDLERVFGRYYTVGRPIADGGGLGLGLFIARQIAELHGGALSAANHPDGGLAVTLRLPLGSGPGRRA